MKICSFYYFPFFLVLFLFSMELSYAKFIFATEKEVEKKHDSWRGARGPYRTADERRQASIRRAHSGIWGGATRERERLGIDQPTRKAQHKKRYERRRFDSHDISSQIRRFRKDRRFDHWDIQNFYNQYVPYWAPWYDQLYIGMRLLEESSLSLEQRINLIKQVVPAIDVDTLKEQTGALTKMLHAAAQDNDINIIDWTLNQGISVDQKTNQKGLTPLATAMQHNNVDAATLLINKEASIKKVPGSILDTFSVKAKEEGRDDLMKYIEQQRTE